MLSLPLLVLPVAAQAAEIAVLTTRHGDSFEIEAAAEIDAALTAARAVLTDHDPLVPVIPGSL